MSFLSALMGAASTAQSVGVFDPALRLAGYLSNFVYPNKLPDPDSLFAAHRAQLITTGQLEGFLAAQGVSVSHVTLGRPAPENEDPDDLRFMKEAWTGVFRQHVVAPQSDSLTDLLFRQIITIDEWRDALRVSGQLDPTWIPLMERAIKPIPGQGDLVRFALKDVWDQQTVATYQYDAEFPASFQHWMSRIGGDGDASIPPAPGQPAQQVNWAQLYWRAHWANISPTQSYEMFQRLRPGRLEGFGADFQGMRPFTFSNLTDQLRINDYPVPYRQWLAAIAFRKPRLIDIDRFYSSGQINEEEVYKLHLDLGYAPRDARMRTTWLVGQGRTKTDRQSQRQIVAGVIRLYSLGQLTTDQALTRLVQALSSGDFRELRPAGLQGAELARYTAVERQAAGLVDAADLRMHGDRTAKLVSAFRRQYLKGMRSRDEMIAELSAAGFTRQWYTDWLSELDAELASGRLMLSTAQIRRQVTTGIMPMGTARRYLANLGWKAPEIVYLVAEIARDRELEEEKELAQRERTQQKRVAAIASQTRIHEQARARAVRRLTYQSSRNQLRRWYIRGVISEGDFQREMSRRGFNDSTIKNEIAAADPERIAWAERTRLAAGARAAARTASSQLNGQTQSPDSSAAGTP